MLLSNAAEGKMVMCVLLCCSVLQFSSVWIFVVPSFAKFDDQVVGWRGNTCCVHSNGTTAAIATPDCCSPKAFQGEVCRKGLVNVTVWGVAALC